MLEIIDLNNENILSLFLYSALTLSAAETGSGNSDVDSLKSRRGNGKEPLDIGSGSRNRRQNQLQSLPKWKVGTQMPSVRARACAVATDDNTFYVIGMYSSNLVIELPAKENTQETLISYDIFLIIFRWA